MPAACNGPRLFFFCSDITFYLNDDVVTLGRKADEPFVPELSLVLLGICPVTIDGG
jgi:hypothetical protein